jgi:hypothetical protein
VVDTFSEVYHQLRPWIHADFWDFGSHDPIPDSVYVIGRKQFMDHRDKVLSLIEDPRFLVVFDNAAEGSWTLSSQLQVLKLDDIARARRMLVIGGGDMEDEYAYIRFDHFLSCIFDYQENLEASSHIDQVLTKENKPYTALFLNGRARPHRKYLYERFRESGLLDSMLWTMLDGRPSLSRNFRLEKDGVNLMSTVSPIRTLDPQYEYHLYRGRQIRRDPIERSFVKNQLFGADWGEIYLEPKAYIDTYFSLVTETVFDQPWSFRTEKIAKVLAMGHPWIAASGTGFYRDLKNLGFKTFDGIIDESFDSITNSQSRLDRIFDVVTDLCQQDLDSFSRACTDVCKYNQELLKEFGQQHREEFPDRFFNFVNQHG